MADKKMPPINVLKEMAGEGVELPEEILDEVAGGAYTDEEWWAMTTEERQAAQQRSLIAKLVTKTPCEMD